MGAAAADISETSSPETGISILRTGDEAAYLRNRLERSANIGRYAMVTVGSIAAAAGVATRVTSASEVGVAIAAFGSVLIALGVVQHFLYRLDLSHWPTDVLLQEGGLELILANGEIRGAMWSDADFGLQLVARPAPPPATREFLLVWLTDSRIPPAEITSEGFDRICQLAGQEGLQIAQRQRGRRTNPVQFVQIQVSKNSAAEPRGAPAAVDEFE